MAARPDKYPALDPRTPGIYGLILKVAAEMRARQRAEQETAWLMARIRARAQEATREQVEEAARLSSSPKTSLTS